MPLDFDAWERDGFAVLKDFLPGAECDALRARAAELVAGFAPPIQRTMFSTEDQRHADDRYFSESGDAIRFFFEEAATDQPTALALNKIGHALWSCSTGCCRTPARPTARHGRATPMPCM